MFKTYKQVKRPQAKAYFAEAISKMYAEIAAWDPMPSKLWWSICIRGKSVCCSSEGLIKDKTTKYVIGGRFIRNKSDFYAVIFVYSIK